MRDRGWSLNRIAWVLGISKTTVRRDLDEEVRVRELEGSRDRRRLDRGVCADCGGGTARRSGGGFSVRCNSCARAKIAREKKWTREAIIDAIRRYAAANGGRPPGARKWRRADPVNDYPANGSVYRRRSHPGAPFASWADAIEAAGFPRPPSHHYERTEEGEKRRLDALRSSLERRRGTVEAPKFKRKMSPPSVDRRDVLVPADVVRRLPPTERLAGDVDAHLLLRTFDCQAYGCVRDAEPGKQFCRRHLDAT